MPSIILEKSEQEEVKIVEHPNSIPEQIEIESITEQMNTMYAFQRQAWREFGDRSLKDYEDDNQKRINNYVEPRGEDLDDWQTRGFEGITREKMFAFVSKVAMNRPKYAFKATRKDGFIDKIISDVTQDFHTFSWNTEDPSQVEFFLDAWQTAGSGTCIVWEGVEQTEDILEEFDSYDITTGKLKGLKTKSVLSDVNCKRRRVPLTQFFIWDWHEPDIQRQPCLAETQTLSQEEFQRLYGNFKHADKVVGVSATKEMFGDSFYLNQWENVKEDKVHVTHFYTQKNGKKQYRIVANGILILATPLPRKDNKFPFARFIFKPTADPSMFYGKALPDEIASDQDVYNAFKNMVIDRALLYIQRPMVGNGSTEVDDLILRPHGIINYKGTLQPLDLEPPSANDIQILEYLRASVNRQTSDAQQSGQAGSGVTAREIVIADENARKLAGVFRLFLEAGDIQATRLRVGNILQFYLEPSRIEEIITESGQKELQMIYRPITIENTNLSDKKRGTRIINLVPSREKIPSREELDIEEAMAKVQGFEMEKLVLNVEYIKQFQVDITIKTESSYEQSRSLELAMQNEYMLLIAKLFPQKFQQFQDVFFRQINEIYDKDMTDFEMKGKENNAMMPLQLGAGGAGEITSQLAQPEINSLARLTGVQV